MKKYLKLLSHKNFVLLWASQFLSQIAINILNFVIIVNVFEITGLSIASSAVWVAFLMPAVAIGPIASTIIDFLDKRKVLMASNLAQSLIIFLYAMFAPHDVILSFLIVLGYSFFNQFYIPSELSSVPFLLKNSQLSLANGLFMVTYQLGVLLGFGLAGIFTETLGRQNTLYLASASIFLAFLSVSLLPSMRSDENKIDLAASKMTHFVKSLFEGINLIKNNKMIYMPFLLMAALHVGLSVVFVNLPKIATDLLQLRATYAGPSIVIPAGVGALLGLSAMPYLEKKFRKAKIINIGLWSIEVVALLLLFVIPLISSKIILYFTTPLFVLIGFGYIIMFITAQTMLQINTPKKFMGRVFGNAWFLSTSFSIIPIVLSSALADLLGISMLFIILSLVVGVILLLYEQLTYE